MNLGIYKNFIVEDEEEGLLDILKNFESGQDIDDLKVKSANAKTVVYIVSSDKRFESQTALNQQLQNAGYSVSKKFISSVSNSQETTEFLLPSGARRRIGFKPTKGFQKTTERANITELFPAIAFLNNISPSGTVDSFFEAISQANPSKRGSPGPYLSDGDVQSGLDTINVSQPSVDFKVREKLKNAQNITKWLNNHNQKHPIAEIYWGYRRKPDGVDAANPGDIFL